MSEDSPVAKRARSYIAHEMAWSDDADVVLVTDLLAERDELADEVQRLRAAIASAALRQDAVNADLWATIEPDTSPGGTVTDQNTVPTSYTERGFVKYEPQTCSYGTVVRLQESSAAFVDRLWIFMDGLTGPGQANHSCVPGESAAHLTYENAEAIRDQLTAWLETHEPDGEEIYLGDDDS